MRRLTFPRILIVFYGVAVAAALLIYFLTGRNLPIRETILILTFLFLLLYRIHFFCLPTPQLNSPRNKTPAPAASIHALAGWGCSACWEFWAFLPEKAFCFCSSGSLDFSAFSMRANFPIRCGTNVSSSTSSAPVPPPASWASPHLAVRHLCLLHRRPAPFPLFFDGHAGAEPGRHHLFAALPAVPLRPAGGLEDGDISL